MKTAHEHQQTAQLYFILFLISLLFNFWQYQSASPARENCAREAQAIIREWQTKK
jgi:hypothetical protein